MKLSRLVQSNTGVPFYKLKEGDLFRFIIEVRNIGDHFFSPYYLITNIESDQILMKVDQCGAIDYPHNIDIAETVLYIHDKEIVQIIEKTDKLYEEYLSLKEMLKENSIKPNNISIIKYSV
jgi:hypothetical protein